MSLIRCTRLMLRILDLRTFALIVTVHPYCAHKFTCHVMHPARALSTKLNNNRADGIVIPLLGFNDLGRTVTPTFLFRNRFYTQLSPHYPKINKKSTWEVKKILDFCPRDLESCHLTAAKRVKLWSLNTNLFNDELHQLSEFT